MEYVSKLSLLSEKFIRDYPHNEYPELMCKSGRPYTCLLINTHKDYYICVPFCSSIGHKNVFMFKDTVRSQTSKSGLDYSKIAIINIINYFDFTAKAIADSDEYAELIKNLPVIVNEVIEYVDTYINYINGTTLLHPRAFTRKYQYSTLPYFHDIMKL